MCYCSPRLHLILDGRFTEDSIREYLVMLSVAETCGYQNIDVLKFLLDRADNSSAAAAATGCAIADGITGLAGAGEGAAGAAETSVNDIDKGENAFNHVVEGHTAGGADAAGNSIFLGDAQDVANAIQNADTGTADVFEQTWNSNTVYVNYS